MKGKLRLRKPAFLCNKEGMEMVQVAILVAIAVTIGLIFRRQISDFVNDTFNTLSSTQF